MEPKHSKYDTNPLDEKVADRAEHSIDSPRPGPPTEDVEGGPTRDIGRKDTEAVRGHSVRDLVARVDLPGVAAFGGAITALLVFLLSLPKLDWIALGISVAVAAGLVVLELRVSNPFLDIRLLVSNLALTRTYVRYCLTLLGIYAVLYGLTQWTEAAHHLSGYQAGLALIPPAATIASGSVAERSRS